MSDQTTPSQLRAARALLGWSKLRLAGAAGVSVVVVMNAEGHAPERVSNGERGAVRVALETAGVRFLDDNGDGVGIFYIHR